MLITINLGPEESPVWNLMWQMYVPLHSAIADLGHAYEVATEKFKHYATHDHDTTDILSAFVYVKLMAEMDVARNKLQPYKNEWYCARYGYSLN